MYSDFYRLSGKPFQLSPNPRFFYGSAGHQKALAYLQYGLHQGEGFIVVTGDIGTGKTTLLGHLLSQLDGNKYLTAKLVTTQLEADDTLRMLASTFGIETRNADKATLLRSFERLIIDNQRRGRRILVIVDEVQNLPLKSIEELRMLSNFQVDDLNGVQFLLTGQPQFRDILASEDLVQLRQRVVVAYHLGPLSVDETRAYIEHRLQLVNWRSDPAITDAAFRRIHHFAAGVPRQINVLCDRLFLCGMLEELHEIDERVVDTVASEMSTEGMRPARNGNGNGAAVNGAPVASYSNGAAASVLEDRLASVEKLVKVHDRTIRRAIELTAAYLNRAPKPGESEVSASDASA
jgi:general secretion pathway protein A